MDSTAAKHRTSTAAKRVFTAMAAPSEHEHVRMAPDVYAAECAAIVAERVEALEHQVEMHRKRIGALERKLKEEEQYSLA